MDEIMLRRRTPKELRAFALTSIWAAISCVETLGLDAALWDLQAARRRVEDAREKDGAP